MNPPYKMPYAGITEEASIILPCEDYETGRCSDFNESENDYCPFRILLWKLEAFESEATDWWNELE